MRRWSVVRAYYTAPFLGFQGRYGSSAASRNSKLVRGGLGSPLDGNVEGGVGAGGRAPPERLEKVRQFGSLRIAFLAGGIFCLAMVWWVGWAASYYRARTARRSSRSARRQVEVERVLFFVVASVAPRPRWGGVAITWS
jgi:hypothetical protein